MLAKGALMCNIMHNLRDEANCHNSQTDSNDHQCSKYNLPGHMGSWSIWFIGNGFHFVQVLQHMLHLTYRMKAFFGGTPNSFHHDRSQSRGEIWFKSQERRRVLTNMLIHD